MSDTKNPDSSAQAEKYHGNFALERTESGSTNFVDNASAEFWEEKLRSSLWWRYPAAAHALGP